MLAAAPGSVTGFERKRLSCAAGWRRTHMLIGVGSALIIIVSAYGFADMLSGQHVVLDPSRKAAPGAPGIEYEALCERLRQLPGAKRFLQDETPSKNREIVGEWLRQGRAAMRQCGLEKFQWY